MADNTLEKAAITPALSRLHQLYLGGYTPNDSAFKVVDSSANVLPLLVICPDGNVAGSASTKADVAKLNAQCREKS
jgi:hypothetical protein